MDDETTHRDMLPNLGSVEYALVPVVHTLAKKVDEQCRLRMKPRKNSPEWIVVQ